MEFFEQPLSDRARMPIADRALVDPHDGDDLGGGARQETLVGDIQVVARQVLFADLGAEVLGDGDDLVARDALENPGRDRRREKHAVAHDEQVVARALRHEALVVEHDGLERAGVDRLDLRQDVV